MQLLAYESNLSNRHIFMLAGVAVLYGIARRAKGLHILGRRGSAAAVPTRARLKSR